jgi:hypothetical protein
VIEPKDVQDAEDDTDLKLTPFVNPDASESPITFLGYHGGRVVFAMPEGEIRDITTGDVAKLIQIDLFNSREGQAFLTYWRDREDKLQRNSAAIWFIRQCRDAGYWAATREQRRLGVWPGQDGEVILHRGPELWIYRPDEEPEIVTIAEALRDGAADGPIYRLDGKAPTPGPAIDVSDGEWIRAQLDMWRFEPIGDDGLTGADIVAGWLMAGLLGAVAPFRPHVLIYAAGGSGKTTLLRYVHALLSALAGGVMDTFTPAGLRSDLAGLARPVMIDEAEAKANSNGEGPVEQALDVIRKMATGEGAVRKMGGMDGNAVTQTAIGAVMMVAVNPVKLQSTDASRIADLRLLKLVSEPKPGQKPRRLATDAELKAATAKAKKLAPGLLGRALVNADRFAADMSEIKAAFIRQKLDPRAADLVAALAAGRCVLMRDDPLDETDADEEARFWSGLLEARALAEIVTNIGQDCLAHLFNWSSGQHVHDRVITIGELVRKCVFDADGGWADALKELGVMVKKVPDANGQVRNWLFVANNHPALERIYRGAKWPDYRKALTFVDELGEVYQTVPSNKTLRFGMIVSRALGIPLDPWLVTPVTADAGERYTPSDGKT